MSKAVRRIVTGHDDQGRAVFISDGPPDRTQSIGTDGPVFYEIWNTRATPAPIAVRCTEPHEDKLTLPPPRKGTRIRVLDIPPETARLRSIGVEEARAHFAEIGAVEASTHTTQGAPHPFMHRTESIDYGIVLEGEITLILDKGETIVRAGEIVVQCGTNHAWSNRSTKNCRIAFVLIDGEFESELRDASIARTPN